LEGVGIITLLDIGERIVLEKEGIKVQLTGCPYNYDIDSEGSRAGYVVKKAEDVQYAVNMVHGMLLNKPFFEGMRYTLIDDIKDTEADITLAGHYHSGFGVIQKSGKYFVNPGSLVRIANASGEIARRPKVVYIELSDSITIKEIELLSAKEGEEVLDRLELERNLERAAKLGSFYREISTSSEYKKIDMKMIIEEIAASDNLDIRVKEEAVRRIIAAGENLQEED
ncbi:MAG TPA: metallophosphoesterase, partial [Clostridia bacterium]